MNKMQIWNSVTDVWPNMISFKIQDGGQLPFLKSFFGQNSAANCLISVEFCTRKQNSMPKMSDDRNSKFRRKIAITFGVKKNYNGVATGSEKNWRYVYSFRQNTRTWRTDRQTDELTDRQTDTERRHSLRLCLHRAAKINTSTGHVLHESIPLNAPLHRYLSLTFAVVVSVNPVVVDTRTGAVDRPGCNWGGARKV